MAKKQIKMTIKFSPRQPGPLSPDERKQLADFFMALMDLDPEKNVIKGYFHAKSNQ